MMPRLQANSCGYGATMSASRPNDWRQRSGPFAVLRFR